MENNYDECFPFEFFCEFIRIVSNLFSCQLERDY